MIFRERRKDYKNHIVISVRKYIGQNVKERLSLNEIAETLGFESAFYFSKVFKKVEGCSPTEYINSKII